MTITTTGSVEDNEISLACAALVAGKHGPKQPRSVRRRLVDLELAGLAVYSLHGWRLTDQGKARARALVAEAHRAEAHRAAKGA